MTPAAPSEELQMLEYMPPLMALEYLHSRPKDIPMPLANERHDTLVLLVM